MQWLWKIDKIRLDETFLMEHWPFHPIAPDKIIQVTQKLLQEFGQFCSTESKKVTQNELNLSVAV